MIKSFVVTTHLSRYLPITWLHHRLFKSTMDKSLEKSEKKSQKKSQKNQKKSETFKSKNKDQLRNVRYKKKLGTLPIPSVVSLQVIGSGSHGTSKSVILATEHSRYLFNCGEGVQRICSEFRFKISRIEHVFVTHNSWENIGGLYGLALTLQGTNIPGFKIHGPPRVENVVTSSRDFAEMYNMKITKHDGDFLDHAVSIETIPVAKAKVNEEPDAKRARLESSYEPAKANEEPDASGACSESSIEPSASMSYLCKFVAPRGKLCLEKYVELGIPRNHIYLRALTSGESITLEDGRQIKPDDVMNAPVTVKPVLICDCPSDDYLDNMMSCESLTNLPSSDNCPQLIVHFAPLNVRQSVRYQSWMKSFGSETTHILLDETKNPLVSSGIYKVQTSLNLLHDKVFPQLPALKNDSEMENNIYYGQTNLAYHIRKPLGIDFEKCIEIDNQLFLDAIFSQDINVNKELELFRTKLSSVENGLERKNPYPEIIFLGTGSSVPSRDRNVSGILLHISENQSMLLDCGEGSLAQIWRHYGAETPKVLEKIKCIFVSHMHADHHMGIFNVINAINKMIPKQIPVLAPGIYIKWLKTYKSEIDADFNRIQVHVHEGLMSEDETSKVKNNAILELLSLAEYKLVKVKHTNSSYAVCLTHKDGWKIVYSGDTMPCDDLVTAGKNCDILIHEATMEDDLAEDAVFKSHSTTSQAIDIGMRMNAKFILLNHFSQRYSKIPMINAKFSDRVGISFDNMRVTLDDLPILPLFTEPLKYIFAESYADMEVKTEKKRLEKVQLEAERQKVINDGQKS